MLMRCLSKHNNRQSDLGKISHNKERPKERKTFSVYSHDNFQHIQLKHYVFLDCICSEDQAVENLSCLTCFMTI